MKPLRFLKLWLGLGWLYVLLIIYLSLTSLPSSGVEIPHLDKIGHTLAYFLMVFWFGQCIQEKPRMLKYALFAGLLGAELEVLQGMGGLRQAEWADALANMAGAFLAWFFWPKTGRLLLWAKL